jgi:hypothetical protein
MNKSKPASLDSSLLARKGQATPAIPDDSPLMSGLVEPRPKPGGGKFGLDRVTDGMVMKKIGPMRTRLIIATGIVLLLAVIAVAFWSTKSDLQVSDAKPVPVNVETDGGGQAKGTAASSKPTEPAIKATEGETLAKIAPASGEVLPSGKDPIVQNLPEREQVATLTTPAPPKPTVKAAISQTSSERPEIFLIAPIVKPTPKRKKTSLIKPVQKAARVSVPTGRYAVQLASFRNERRAVKEAERLQKRIGKYLKGHKIAVVKGTVAGKGSVWRLRAKGYVRSDARAICKQVKRLKTKCLALKLKN